MDAVVAIDFGSTYTKGVVFDRAASRIAGVAHTPSTVSTDITIGLRRVLAELRERARVPLDRMPALACSSAAGGLRVAVIGLVPALSLEAAQRAALGAGARIVGAYGYKLTRQTLGALNDAQPDIVLLAGGTDGGDEDNILHNASALARSAIGAPVIVAGNCSVQDDCIARLREAGKTAIGASNLLPEVDRIEPGPVHEIIRDLFIQRITHAKGIDRAGEYLNLIADVIPTPSAVLDAARLIAEGADGAPGLGDTLVVDVGGATTDVYSIASGAPTRPGVITRGLPELRVKRTVEGDIGMRINAPSIVERVGASELLALASSVDAASVEACDVTAYAQRISACTDSIPESAEERAFEQALGRAAVRTAVARHAGSLREVYTPSGFVLVQEGKDLSEVAAVVGIGGVLVHGVDARFVLEGALGRDDDRFNVLPRRATFHLDRQYVLYGVGLLASIDPRAALALAREALTTI